MKTLVVIGIVLCLIGGLILAYQGFSYITHEKVVDAGPIQVNAEKEHFVFLPPVLGAVALGTGIVLIVVGGRSRSTA